MTQKEIRSKFNEIVAFAEIEKFLDTPVKRYSSGMYVRLAFAVAAHLEPEILIVDEVLAVGDAQFQKKCLGKIEEVTKKNSRTILFVSHNMGAIERICSKVILLVDGKIAFIGQTREGIKAYTSMGLGSMNEKRWENLKLAPGDNVVKIIRVFCHKEGGEITDFFDITKKIGITFEYEVIMDRQTFTHGLNVYNEDGTNVFNSHDTRGSIERNIGKYSTTVWIPENLLAEGVFSISVAILSPTPFILHAHGLNVLSFNVFDNIEGKSSRGFYTGGFPGIVRPLLKWNNKKY
jgi:lipopolysaccharide transport system ATP-binding protein